MKHEIPHESIRHVRVLVVDDHFSTRDLVKSILRSVGFVNITQAEGGHAALARVRESEPHLIICDWNMPDMPGIDVLKSVRQNPEYHSIPFLMLTAEVYKENVQAAIDEGVTDYIAKPFTAETLIAKIMKILKQTIVTSTGDHSK
ncbi:MAG: response regulator [Bdellovibrionales bacterium]|nr:response regulator [Bdellovibrionales bacterium]